MFVCAKAPVVNVDPIVFVHPFTDPPLIVNRPAADTCTFVTVPVAPDTVSVEPDVTVLFVNVIAVPVDTTICEPSDAVICCAVTATGVENVTLDPDDDAMIAAATAVDENVTVPPTARMRDAENAATVPVVPVTLIVPEIPDTYDHCSVQPFVPVGVIVICPRVPASVSFI